MTESPLRDPQTQLFLRDVLGVRVDVMVCHYLDAFPKANTNMQMWAGVGWCSDIVRNHKHLEDESASTQCNQ